MSPAGDDWSWPPPGLERLAGVLPAAARRGIVANLLVGTPLLWILTSRQTLAGPAGSILGLLLALGMAAYLGAILRAAAALDLARRGRRLGYPGGVLLDVLTDRNGSAGPLVRGDGAFAEVRPRIRTTVRRLRRGSGLVAVLAGLVPLPLLCLGILLAFRGAASPASVALLLLAPFGLLALTALVLRGYATLLLEWERSAGAWDPSPVLERDLAAGWQAAFAATPASPRTRPPGLLPVVALAAAGVSCFVLLFVTTGAVGAVSGWTGRGTRTRIAEDAAALAGVAALRPLLPPVLEPTSADSAAAAFHALLSAAGDVRPGMRPAPPLPPLWDGARPAPASYRTVWRMVLGDSTAPPVPDWAALAEHPGLAQLAVLARATALDPVGARWQSVVPATEFGAFGSRETALRLLALRPVRDAAVQRRAGNRARSRAILRDLLAAGLVLVEHGRTPAELHLGHMMADAGGTLLLEDDAGAGAVADARAAIERALRRSRPTAAATDLPIDALRFRVLDAELYPALRWDALRQLRQRERCGSLAALLFADPAADSAWQRLAGSLLHSRGDSLAFVALSATSAGEEPAGRTRRARRILRAAEAIGGRGLARSPCVAALLRGD